MSDLGGLFGAVSPLFVVMISLLNWQSSYQFIMGDLFLAKSHDGKRYSLETNDVQWRSCKSLYLTCLSRAPRLFKCCKPLSKHEKLRVHGLKYVLKELQVSHIIKQLRVLKAVVRKDKTAKQWALLKKQYSYIAYSDLDSENDSQQRVVD